MGAGQIIGANVGAHLVMKKSLKFIRPLFIATVLIVTIIISIQAYG